MTFTKPNPKQSFPELETTILQRWKENNTFQKSINSRKEAGAEEFRFYDGPPFATGTPHYGHILAGTLKDVVLRYKTMKGFFVDRKFGWDCHGMPIENIVEKKLEVKNKQDIEENIGVHKFNETCRENVFGYVDEWKKVVERMGRWVDMDDDYKTMDRSFMESVWWVFKELYKKDAIYESYRVVPYSVGMGTPVSNFEVNQGYKDKQDKTATVKFKVAGTDSKYILAWTTTPWTLPANLGLAVGVDINYVELLDKESGETYILASDRIDAYYKSEDDYELITQYSGRHLEGLEYEPLYSFYDTFIADPENEKFKGSKTYTVIIGHHVTTESGTGVVHIAPAYGEDDYIIGTENNLGFFAHIGDTGHTENLADAYNGKWVFDFNEEVLQELKSQGKVVKIDTIVHSYPHCWRTDVPLIYRAISAWYVKVEDIREKLLANNEKINWVPDAIKNGRFGKWLEGARDWNISRNRYWGSAMPVWQSEDKKHEWCVGSIEELYELNRDFGQIEKQGDEYFYTETNEPVDIHKHYVDKIQIKHPESGETLTRIPEVLDCWFESGSMPYASVGYKGEGDFSFPGEFIAEGLDQTRGWFYTLLILGTHLYDISPYKNVIVNGIVLAEDGEKMSKSKKNYPDPSIIFDNYGADAMRFYLMNSPIVKAESLRFAESGVAEVVKKVILPLWNAYTFFTTYANIDNYEPKNTVPESDNELDRWIIAELHRLIYRVTKGFDEYKLQEATHPFTAFLDNLNNWYIRRNRRRFWKSENDTDKMAGYDTLYYVLTNLCKLLAPVCPFVTENIYTELTGAQSVHLEDYPVYHEPLVDFELMEKMQNLQNIINLGLAYRSDKKIRVRQPLPSISVTFDLADTDKEILKEELNVKEVLALENIDQIATKVYAPDARKIGQSDRKRFMKDIISKAKSGDAKETADGLEIVVSDGSTVTLDETEYSVKYETKGDITLNLQAGFGTVIAIDDNLSEELILEGYARDLIRSIQDMRKEAGYEVTDRVKINIYGDHDQIDSLISQFGSMIAQETLSEISAIGSADLDKLINLGEFKCNIAISK